MLGLPCRRGDPVGGEARGAVVLGAVAFRIVGSDSGDDDLDGRHRLGLRLRFRPGGGPGRRGRGRLLAAALAALEHDDRHPAEERHQAHRGQEAPRQPRGPGGSAADRLGMRHRLILQQASPVRRAPPGAKGFRRCSRRWQSRRPGRVRPRRLHPHVITSLRRAVPQAACAKARIPAVWERLRRRARCRRGRMRLPGHRRSRRIEHGDQRSGGARHGRCLGAGRGDGPPLAEHGARVAVVDLDEERGRAWRTRSAGSSSAPTSATRPR